jgi:hypothetical protein
MSELLYRACVVTRCFAPSPSLSLFFSCRKAASVGGLFHCTPTRAHRVITTDDERTAPRRGRQRADDGHASVKHATATGTGGHTGTVTAATALIGRLNQ